MVEASEEEGRDGPVQVGTPTSIPGIDEKSRPVWEDRQIDGPVVPGKTSVTEGQPLMNGNGRPIKDVHDRICDMILFAMAGGLVYGLAIHDPILLDGKEIAILTGGLVGAVTMYLKGK